VWSITSSSSQTIASRTSPDRGTVTQVNLNFTLAHENCQDNMATEILRIHVLSVAGLLKSHHSRDLMVVEFAIT
jgi:hypothetical protein